MFGLVGAASGLLGAASGGGGGAYGATTTDETSVSQRTANQIGGVTFGSPGQNTGLYLALGGVALALIVLAITLRK